MSSYSEQSLAAGIPVFQRTKALEQCLESLNEPAIDRVIIADNGHADERTTLYERDWLFELTILELEYDVGIGQCRAAIADELKEDYLLVMDNDMTVPSIDDLDILQKVLDARSELGGVGATLIEDNRFRSGCTNLHEEDLMFNKKAIVHDIRTEPEIDWVDDEIPIVEFDKIAQAAVIRRECIEDYSWDPRFPVGEHLDFFLGHYHKTDWHFAVTPIVVFNHHKRIDREYRSTVRSSSNSIEEKKEEMEFHYQNKWGYHTKEYGYRPFWIDSQEPPLLETVYRLLQRYIPVKYLLPIKYRLVNDSDE